MFNYFNKIFYCNLHNLNLVYVFYIHLHLFFILISNYFMDKDHLLFKDFHKYYFLFHLLYHSDYFINININIIKYLLKKVI
jgi:hypothetical protein